MSFQLGKREAFLGHGRSTSVQLGCGQIFRIGNIPPDGERQLPKRGHVESQSEGTRDDRDHYDNHHHFHKNNWTYVLYLNDNFDGGEIEFKNGDRIKPERGDMIGFDETEAHRVIRPYNFKPQTFTHNGMEYTLNRRFSLVGFMKENIFGKDIKNKSII